LPVWNRFDFVPLVSGVHDHTIRVTWEGRAVVRFSVFEVTDQGNQRLVITPRGTSPQVWTGSLDSRKNYFLSLWADVNFAGRADYLVTIERTSAGGINAESPVQQTNTSPLTEVPTSSWQLQGIANVVLAVDDVVYVGGDFTAIYNNNGSQRTRNYLAAINRYTGEPTGFAPKLDDRVWALAASPDNKTLYVGGSFLTAEGVNRTRVAAYDMQTGALTTFNPPSPNVALRSIAVSDDKVYLGGLFTAVGGQKRTYVAAFDRRTGNLDRNFNVVLNNRVMALIAGPDYLWLGGDFTRVNGFSQRGVAAVDLDDGKLMDTDGVTYPVIDLAASATQIFVAGGGPGGRAAAFNRSTGREQWEIASDGNFQSVDVDDGRYVYFGGHYETVEGDRNFDRMTRHNKTNGQADTSWVPRLNGIRSVNSLSVTSDGLHVGGDFTRVNFEPHEGFVIFSGSTD